MLLNQPWLRPPPGGMSSSSNRTIHLNLKYILWDYQINDFISYGTAFGYAQAKYFIVKSDWPASKQEIVKCRRLARWPVPPAPGGGG